MLIKIVYNRGVVKSDYKSYNYFDFMFYWKFFPFLRVFNKKNSFSKFKRKLWNNNLGELDSIVLLIFLKLLWGFKVLLSSLL